ncbi:MAG: hydantoinase/oxoprolinase family protein [Pseudomonadota bacterium]
MRHALAIDIGGTFTDVVLIRSDGRAWSDKTLTTHHDLLEGLFRAADLALEKAGVGYAAIDDVFAHATTVITNMLIERKGEPTALLTTKGFTDVLYIRDEHRYDMFDPQIELPEPIIPAETTWGLNERVYADGTIGAAVDEAELRKVADEMKAAGVKSVAVCLLNAYANPENERTVRSVLEAALPDAAVSLSSDVAPQMREYLRASTTALNAYAAPTALPYLTRLVSDLKARARVGDPLIMLSNGGVVGAKVAARYPVRMIESGPAAGALVASHFARAYGLENMISFDMGGTTAKACLIQKGEPLISGEFEVDRRYRFKPGSGMPITVPSIDMIEIGAGGGSIARVDALGLMKVGPDSAGSAPGPACYGRGGENACVTDADVALNILDPDNFLGGDMKLDAAASRNAIGRLADKLGISINEAAYGIFSIVGESMAGAARAHATDRGVNYRGLPMLAFGGAGPVHACYVAERLESARIIYPPMASVLSAYGTLVTPARLDLARSGLASLKEVEQETVTALIESMIAEGEEAIVEAGMEASAARYVFSADMRYAGQQSEVTVPLPADPRRALDKAAIRDAFEAAYEELYGVRLDEMGVEVVNWRVTASAGDAARNAVIPMASAPGAPKSSRDVFLDGTPTPTPVYDRTALATGQTIDGPVLIEERETTIFILPGWVVTALEDGSLIADRTGAGGGDA